LEYFISIGNGKERGHYFSDELRSRENGAGKYSWICRKTLQPSQGTENIVVKINSSVLFKSIVLSTQMGNGGPKVIRSRMPNLVAFACAMIDPQA